jgi:NAD(P)-dependent dehydrogenase (short-subunit alcohol dehydrogenase family)
VNRPLRINADVRKEDDVRAMVDKTIARFGRLDVAVNNAATEGQVGPITNQTAESYAATFDTNVLGVILCMKHEVRVMQKQGSGNIVNISSTYGHEGAAGTPENKAALVSTVPMACLGLPEEQANAIVFLASVEASFITGHILNVDGGKTH